MDVYLGEQVLEQAALSAANVQYAVGTLMFDQVQGKCIPLLSDWNFEQLPTGHLGRRLLPAQKLYFQDYFCPSSGAPHSL